MVNIAVLGYGVVGSGVVDVIRGERISQKASVPINVKKIFLRDRSKCKEFHEKTTLDFSEIENDPEISIVVEVIGGIDPAYSFTKRALKKGKHVVTANKELVSTHGAELMQLARENGVSYMFEASVGGGIPIIRPLVQCLVSDDIVEIMGILNGTTNYILSQMIHNSKTFPDALKEAQEKGYAESDPTADIEGIDTCRKIAILSSLCFGKQVNPLEISTEGITKITLDDIKNAEKENSVIKLIGFSRKNNDGSLEAYVKPMKIPVDHPLASVEDVFNSVLVKGTVTGDVMFYGRGAGRLPTASAVVADVVDIVRNGCKNAPFWLE